MNNPGNINNDIRAMHDNTRSRIAKLKEYRDTVKHNAELFVHRTNQLVMYLDNSIKMEELALQPLIDSAHGRVSELTAEEKAIVTANEIRAGIKEDKPITPKETKPNGRIKVDENGKEYIDITADDHE